VESDIGNFSCKKAICLPGTKVTLCLRPEFIRPRHSSAGDGAEGPAINRAQGTVETLLFVGDAYEGEIRVGETLLMARIDPDTDFKVGDKVVFQVPPEHCLVVAK
jgi:iron(III) transport system ATP-binding protein